MGNVWQDLRYGARMLMKHPGFTSIAVIMLALGTGANTAIFSFINALLLKPVSAVAEPDRLVQLGRATGGRNFSTISMPEYLIYRDRNNTLTGLALRRDCAFHLSAGSDAERVEGALVSGNYFDALGVRPALGRLLSPADTQREGETQVAVIGYGLWQRRFGGDVNVAGKRITLNAHTYTVLGVAGEGFQGTQVGEKSEVWVPVTMWRQHEPVLVGFKTDWFNSSGATWLNAFGRLKSGVTIEQAQAEFDTIAAQLRLTYPKEYHQKEGARLVPGIGMFPQSREQLRNYAKLPAAAVAIVLLIACANVAGLLLSQSEARRREIAVRLALGAGRGRVVRQLLTECSLLVMIGAALGVAVTVWVCNWLNMALPDRYLGLPLSVEADLDWRVLGFMLALSALTCVLAGLAPALQQSKQELITALKDQSGPRRAGRWGLRGLLVVAQIALSLVLLVGAGLCIRTLRNAYAVPLGLSAEQVLTARFDVGRQNYSEEQGRLFYRQLIERVEALPGVRSAGLGVMIPLGGYRWGTSVTEGGKSADAKSISVTWNIVTPHFLESLNIPLLMGRQFTDQDSANSPRVAIINESMARRLWPGENPLGNSLRLNRSGTADTLEIVGLARDAKGAHFFEQNPAQLFVPVEQQYQGQMTLFVRADAQVERLIPAVQKAVTTLDPNLPVYETRALASYVDEALMPQRLAAMLISCFGLLALLLAAIGIYGVLSYVVSQRTQEIGIRMALGAQTREVLKLIIGQGMRLSLIGMTIGLAAAIAVTRLMRNLLFGVSATDPLTFVIISLLLIFVSLIACWIPARRAMKVDPMIALRTE